MPMQKGVNKNSYGNGVFCTLNELVKEKSLLKNVDLHLRKKSQSIRSGAHRSSIRGRGMEFFESRPYVPLDEIRFIDWKVSARLNKLHTKVFVEERDRPIYLVVDLRSTMFFGTKVCFKSVLACKIAARLLFAGLSGGDRIAALVFSDDDFVWFKPKKSKSNTARILGSLADYSKKEASKTNKHINLANILFRLSKMTTSGASVFFISDFYSFDDTVSELLYSIRKKADIFALNISDPLEKKLPDAGVLGMEYKGDEIFFDSGSNEIKREYKSLYEKRMSQLHELFLRLDIPAIEFSTKDNIDNGLRKLFSGSF